LLPDSDWEVDLQDLESQIDCNTVAVIYNNPSNPCGSVYSKNHIRNILQVCERHCIPIIADEIYENMVFPGETFYPIASLTTEVPVLSCRGTTKRFVMLFDILESIYKTHNKTHMTYFFFPSRFLIPGMRLGWVTVHDRHKRLGQPVSIDLIDGLVNIFLSPPPPQQLFLTALD